MSAEKLTPEQINFIHGIAWAIIEFNQLFDEPVACKEVLLNSGYKIKHFEEADLLREDLIRIKEIMAS